MRFSCLSWGCKRQYIFRSDWESGFSLFLTPVGRFIFVYEGHDGTFENDPLECTLRSYSCRENQISRSDSGTRFIKYNHQMRGDAQIILLPIENFSFMLHLFYREEILIQINLIQKKLQKQGIGLDVWVNHIDVTKILFNWSRDRLVSELVNQSKTNWKDMEIPVENRIRRKRNLSWEKDDDISKRLVQKVKAISYECHDRLVNELEVQFDSMSHLLTVFVVLSSQAILEHTEGEFEQKFYILVC